MSKFIECAKSKFLNSKNKPIILFAEGWNNEIKSACSVLKMEGLIEPMIILRTKEEDSISLNNIKKVIIEKIDIKKYGQKLYELRKHKGLTLESAMELSKQPNFLSALMVKLGEVDGVVCGIEYTTKDTLKAALQVIKTAPDSEIVTSAILFEKDDDLLIFGDCSLVLNPTSQELAYITKGLIKFASRSLCCSNLNTAMLSYSTNGSGFGESVDKVKKAYEIVKLMPEIKENQVYGEIQFDAAYVNAIRKKKAPNCPMTLRPNIFVFPNLDAGNIGYKILERCGHYLTIGPIIVGLDKPMNDLSRGASVESVVAIAYITAAQALKKG
ncbi:MAG: phosphotransacetylase [Mycoplasmoidaceae bacterium]